MSEVFPGDKRVFSPAKRPAYQIMERAFTPNAFRSSFSPKENDGRELVSIGGTLRVVRRLANRYVGRSLTTRTFESWTRETAMDLQRTNSPVVGFVSILAAATRVLRARLAASSRKSRVANAPELVSLHDDAADCDGIQCRLNGQSIAVAAIGRSFGRLDARHSMRNLAVCLDRPPRVSLCRHDCLQATDHPGTDRLHDQARVA